MSLHYIVWNAELIHLIEVISPKRWRLCEQLVCKLFQYNNLKFRQKTLQEVLKVTIVCIDTPFALSIVIFSYLINFLYQFASVETV